MLTYNTPAEQEELFRKHRKITRSIRGSGETLSKIRIAVLSGVTVHPVKDIVETVTNQQMASALKAHDKIHILVRAAITPQFFKKTSYLPPLNLQDEKLFFQIL